MDWSTRCILAGICLAVGLLAVLLAEQFSEIHCGRPGSGKSEAGARASVEDTGSWLLLDPHERSLARRTLTQAKGNVLFDRLDDKKHALGYGLLESLTSADSSHREKWIETMSSVLLLRSGADGMAATPLREEWVIAWLMLIAHQRTPKPAKILPLAFCPGTREYEALVRDCTLPDIQKKFRDLEKLTPRALRAEVGSAFRVISAVWRTTAFLLRCGAGFQLATFLQNHGRLIVEKGSEISDDAMRVIMGALILKVIDHAKNRKKPFPVIRIRIDEANNAKLITPHVLRGIAELRKYGVFFEFYVQALNFPCSPEEVLQCCPVHHWYACASRELAHKAAIDVAAGLRLGDDESRAKMVERLTDEILQLKAGWRWSRYPWGSEKNYVRMLDEENSWVDWPGLREKKLTRKLERIYARPEYQRVDAWDEIDDRKNSESGGDPQSGNTAAPATSPPTSTDESSSPAETLKRLARRQTGRSARREREDSFE